MKATDESSEEATLKRSLKCYATKVFKESTIGIVSSIASTHSSARRVFKSLVLILCLVGFFYQCITFLVYVFHYPTTVHIDIKKPDTFIAPAFTFCNNNGMKRSVFCSKFPDRCFQPSKKFCSHFRKYCGTNETTRVPKKAYYNLEKSLTYNEILNLGNDLDDLLLYNKNHFKDEPSGPHLRSKRLMSGVMVCYSLHSVVNSTELPRYLSQKDKNFNSNFVESNMFGFYVREDEMFIPGNKPGVLFSIHSPYQAVNPFKKGIFLKSGRSYKIFVTLTQEALLKDPFSTDCINYEEMWEANDRSGPRIQEMCQEKCNLDQYMLLFNCSPASVLYPNDGKICQDFDQLFSNPGYSAEIKNSYLKCHQRCKDDCRVTTYTPEVMERYEIDIEENADIGNLDRYIKVKIVVEAGEVIELRHSPKYMTVEVFSCIGGFIGCWLGFSLMDIVDIFASMYSVIQYAFTKYRK